VDIVDAVHDEDPRCPRIARRQLERQRAIDSQQDAVGAFGQVTDLCGGIQAAFAREAGHRAQLTGEQGHAVAQPGELLGDRQRI